MKLIFVPRALFTVFLLAIFCIGAPAMAADFGSHQAAANSYRKNLPRLRSDQALLSQPFYTNEPSALDDASKLAAPKPAAPKQSNESTGSNNVVEQVVKPIETPAVSEVSDVSDESFFTNALGNRLFHRAAGEGRNPYTTIAAAMRTNSLPGHLFVSPRFVEQLPGQLTRLRTDLQAQPVRFTRAAKAFLSNVLDRVSIKARRMAEQLRQP